MQAADDVTMRLETDNGQWQVKIDPTVIRTKKHALLVAKNIKQLARMLPDTTPRQRTKVEQELKKPQRVKANSKKKSDAEATAASASED